jgi:branched-chain amino acid transport system substrate-binding protein
MVKLHETKLGVPYCTIAAACDAILTALAPLTGPLGITVTSAAVSDPSTTFAGPCLTFKNAGDQAIIPILEPSDIQPFVDTCAQQGLNPTWIFGAVYPFELSDSNAAGSITYLEDFNWTAPGPVATTYRAAMKKYDPSIYTSLAPGEGTAQWASALMFQYAAKLTKAKTPTGKQLIKALNTFKNQTLGGATPPLTFTNGQRYSAACAAQLGVAYGKFIAPDGNGYICSPKS